MNLTVFGRKASKSLVGTKRKKLTIVLAISLILLTIGVVINHYKHAYTSDDVLIQTVLYQHTNLPGSGKAWLGEDNYIIKVPIYFLAQELFSNSRYIIFATLLFFNFVGFILFFYSAFYFFKKFKFADQISTLSVLWLASISPALVAYFLYNPNLRNLEIGLAFWALVLFCKYIDDGLVFAGWPKKILVIALSIFLGMFFYSDPLFAYMLLLPLLTFLSVRIYLEKSRAKLINSLLFLISAIIVSALMRKIFTHFGIMTHHTETKFIAYNQLGHTINLLLDSYFRIFSANFWDANLLTLGTVLRLLNACLMFIVIFGPLILLRSSRFIYRKNPWAIFLLTQPFFLSLVYVLSNNTALNGAGSIRFLVLLPFYAVFILPFFFGHIKSPALKPLLLPFLIVVICLNSLYAVKEMARAHHEHPNSSNFTLINTLRSMGLTKGYANYWDSGVNTYLSDNKIDFVPVNCMQIQHWLMDDHSLNVSAEKTFYLFNPSRTGNCESVDVIPQILGTPNQVVEIGESRIFVFNYDIKVKLRDAYYP
jgi:hypothetical protein